MCKTVAHTVYLLSLVAAFSVASNAQKQVSGTVVDANTGEPLPAATVQVAGTTLGTTTNVDGVFRLYLRSLPAELSVRFIGYNSATLPIEPATSMPVEIRMEPTTYELDELVVVDEDPALNIMRRVIARKQEWIDSLLEKKV